jgi:hypothetical protein
MPPNRAALAAPLHQKPGEILKEPIEATQAATLLPGPGQPLPSSTQTRRIFSAFLTHPFDFMRNHT